MTDVNQTNLASRRDHVFIYEKKGFKIRWQSEDSGYGTTKWQFVVRGDEVSVFVKYFEAPQDFSFAYHQEISSGEFYQKAWGVLKLYQEMADWNRIIYYWIVFGIRFH